MQSRRRFIRLLGGGAVFVAGVSALPQASAGTYPARAVEAWEPIAPDTEIRRWMLAHALLAPNPHNRQPWIADLRKENEITFICDGERLLPETDPFGRQILIGCGAFLELAVMAAAQRGFGVEVNLLPEGEPSATQRPEGTVVARMKVARLDTVKADPLFMQIRKRHSHKGPYDSTKPVPAPDWDKLTAAGSERAFVSGRVIDAAKMEQIRTITRDSFEIEMTTPRTFLESANLFRVGASEIEKHRDGISITRLFVRLLDTFGLFNRQEVPVKGSMNYKQTMQLWAAFETGSGYLWIASSGNSRKQQIECGRTYVRTHLTATALGLDMHPLSQALQEFAEVKTQKAQIHQVLGLDEATMTLQMLVRVGYGMEAVDGTPRRALEGGMLLT